MSYETIDKFVVKVKGAGGAEGKFVLRRQGFDWKLTNIIVPLADEKNGIPAPTALQNPAEHKEAYACATESLKSGYGGGPAALRDFSNK